MKLYAKFFTAAAAALAVAGSLASDGMSTSDCIATAAAFLGAFGVYAVPNSGPQPAQEGAEV
jgi:hypothetical protein